MRRFQNDHVNIPNAIRHMQPKDDKMNLTPYSPSLQLLALEAAQPIYISHSIPLPFSCKSSGVAAATSSVPSPSGATPTGASEQSHDHPDFACQPPTFHSLGRQDL